MFNQNSKSQVEKHFFGNYRGIVVDNRDPLECARVKVRVYGLYDDVPEDSIPWALYSDPFMGGQGNLGGVFIPDEGSEVWVFFENGDHMQPVYFAGAPSALAFPRQMIATDQPETRGDISYPHNRVISTKGGHVIELDDTEGNTRVRISHKNGTQIIMYDNGDVYERIVGDLTRVVFGNLNEYVKGDKKSHTIGNLDIRADRFDLNKAGPTFDISEAEQRSLVNSMPILTEAGTNAVIDEPVELDSLPSLLEQGFPPPSTEDSGNVTEVNATVGDAEVTEVDKGEYGEVDYNLELGCGFRLRDLSVGALYPHSIVAQGGLTTDDIINNLKALVVNILCPLREKYGTSFRINSGFRRGGGRSQHNKGQAVDIQFPAYAGREANYNAVAEFIIQNLPFDQFIFEHGRSVWLHISFDPAKGSSQRKQLLTYHPDTRPQYQSGIRNYKA